MIFRTLLKAIKPFRLISLIMTYLLGAGLVQYVRQMRSWSDFILGGVFLLLIAISVEYLRLLQRLSETWVGQEGLSAKDERQVRLLVAVITATLLTVATTIIITWIHTGVLWQGLVFLLVALVVVGGSYYLSHVNGILKSIEIILEALFYIVIPPAVAYFLQSDDLHPLLTMVVFGLVPSYLANSLLILLQRFARDQKYDIETIVTHMGWENAMTYHNALILFSFLIYALIALLGFPWFLIWPVFLALPIGLLEIYLIERVRRGMKPLWVGMRIASACVLFIPLYLISFAFWIR
jgi:1,4-dihydroxy-2-naphthoate octaprenyltransferase